MTITLADHRRAIPRGAWRPLLDRTPKLVPLYGVRVPAGFPSPADDHVEGVLDLHELLVRHPAATFFVRVQGDSMEGAGIHHGDILVVDRSLEARHDCIVVATVGTEQTVKRLRIGRDGEITLIAANPRYAPIRLQDGEELRIWGVVTGVVRQL